jgi:hypothetical protein
MLIVYGLSARGDSLNGWPFRMRSKKVFHNRVEAEEYIPRFRDMCCDQSHFECANEETLDITIVEYELH